MYLWILKQRSLEASMFKMMFFVFLSMACSVHKTPPQSSAGSLHGFAGVNFSTTNSPCLDGIIAAIDYSCAVPMYIEEGYPYILIRCEESIAGQYEWHKYDVLAVTNNTIEDPSSGALICVDPQASIYIQVHR